MSALPPGAARFQRLVAFRRARKALGEDKAAVGTLFYLDQPNSVGPESLAGERRHDGFNENFAREIMELHKLADAFRRSGGDLAAIARALIAAPQA